MSFNSTSSVASRVFYLQRAKFHIIPGGPQNANSPRLIRYNAKALWKHYKKVGLINVIKDFNQMHSIQFGELGNFRGVDEFGNRYYENLENQFGRHRWVVFAQRRRESSQATLIPAGWWGWMHNARNVTPADENFPKPPKWVLLHKENFTGTDKRYLPTNYGKHNKSDAWTHLRYRSWNPALPNSQIPNVLKDSSSQRRIE